MPGLPDLFASALSVSIEWVKSVIQRIKADEVWTNQFNEKPIRGISSEEPHKQHEILKNPLERQVDNPEVIEDILLDTPEEKSLNSVQNDLETFNAQLNQDVIETSIPIENITLHTSLSDREITPVIETTQSSKFTTNRKFVSPSSPISFMKESEYLTVTSTEMNFKSRETSELSMRNLTVKLIEPGPFQHSVFSSYEDTFDSSSYHVTVADHSTDRRGGLQSFVSPSYSSIAKFIPRRETNVLQSLIATNQITRGVDACDGYTSFGSGGVSKINV